MSFSKPFHTIVAGLKIRENAGVHNTSVLGALGLGDVVNVDPDSRTEADDFIWWNHAAGWSAEASLDRTQVFMLENASSDNTDVELPVPWVSQLTGNADPDKWDDCGQACILMLLKAYDINCHGKDPESLSMGDMTSNVSGETLDSALKTLASDFCLDMGVSFAPKPISLLNAPILQRKAVIVLVNCWQLGFPAHKYHCLTADSMHWVVVVSIKGDDFLINDPLWRADENNGQGGKGGEKLRISADTLAQAQRGIAFAPMTALP